MQKTSYLALRKKLDLQRKLMPFLEYVFIDAVLLAVIASLALTSFAWVATPFIAILMFRNFSLMHDAVHGAVLKNKLLNSAIGVWCGTICLLPFRAWKHSHLQHHYWSGNIEKDPVMALRVNLPKTSPWLQKLISFSWQKWIPTLAFLQYALFWKLALGFAKEKKSAKDWLGLFVPGLFWGAAIALSSATFLLTALLPAVFIYMVAVETVNFPHHLQLPSIDGDEHLPAWEQHHTARSCIYPQWFAKYVVLNFNYHAEHHMFPEAPWYTLGNISSELELVFEEDRSTLHIDQMFDWSKDNRPKNIADVLAPISTIPSSEGDIAS